MKSCDCVIGGDCAERGADVLHRVTVSSDVEYPPVVGVSPRQADEWMQAGLVNTGLMHAASCITCEDDITSCPAFAPYLLSPAWDLPEYGRSELRELVREKYVTPKSRASMMAVLGDLLTVEGVRTEVAAPSESPDKSMRKELHRMWSGDIIRLTDVYYWYRVLSRYAGLQPQQ